MIQLEVCDHIYNSYQNLIYDFRWLSCDIPENESSPHSPLQGEEMELKNRNMPEGIEWGDIPEGIGRFEAAKVHSRLKSLITDKTPPQKYQYK